MFNMRQQYVNEFCGCPIDIYKYYYVVLEDDPALSVRRVRLFEVHVLVGKLGMHARKRVRAHARAHSANAAEASMQQKRVCELARCAHAYTPATAPKFEMLASIDGR